jgi:hypothetical protein
MKKKNGLFILLALVLSSFAAAVAEEFHYPPARLDCFNSNQTVSITFFEYATNNQSRMRYNGNLYMGPVGEGAAYDYDQIPFVELPNNALDFKGTPNDPTAPKFEMHLDRPSNYYTGWIDVTSNGTTSRTTFYRCVESKFVEVSIP